MGGSYSPAQLQMVRALAALGKRVFVPVHITVNRAPFPNYRTDWVDALKLFLRFYAYERAGRFDVYKENAPRAVENCRAELEGDDAPARVWREFERLINGRGSNPRVNCLYPEPGGKYDIITFCKQHAAAGGRNIYLFAYSGIVKNQLAQTHQALVGIRGIGPKIASLFLRDVFMENDLDNPDLRDREMVLPIDTWVQRAVDVFSGTNLSREQAAKFLADIADRARCSPLYLDSGIWYLGSQVAKSEQRLASLLQDPNALRAALEVYRSDLVRQGKNEEARLIAGLLADRQRL
ncbi:MAG: hypothetical protein K6U10_12340 [Acidobacteriia bacterium]|nr:hypothetical protein [Methyloceanibacter sp.]MCL6492591.1 hypothetical protein [Terriglobia bacterium]